MHFTIEQHVPDVTPDEAARWWNHFEAGHGDHPRLPGYDRRITGRTPTSVTMRDEARILRVPIFKEETTAWPHPRGVRFAGRNPFADFDGHYEFDDAGGGTRVRLDAAVHLHRPLRWAEFAARPIVRAILRADLAAHAKEMRRDLKAK